MTARWISAKAEEYKNTEAPASRQHFDVWNFNKADGGMTVWKPTIKQLEKIAEMGHARLGLPNCGGAWRFRARSPR
jgi:hypothetical protein